MIKIEEGFHGGKYARRYTLTKAGDCSHSHRHPLAHHTVLCGRFLVHEEGKPDEACERGALLVIEAGVRHYFTALEDNAVYICTHVLIKDDGTPLTDEEAAKMSPREIAALVDKLAERCEEMAA